MNKRCCSVFFASKTRQESIYKNSSEFMIGNTYDESELIVAFVGAVGVNLRKVEALFADRIKSAGYSVESIEISRDIIPKLKKLKSFENQTEYVRIQTMMDAGNAVRKKTRKNNVLALGVASNIRDKRETPQKERSKTAYIIHSLKRPEEVRALREIYPRGFHLVGVHSSIKRREEYLVRTKNMTQEQALELMARDENEDHDNGQRIIETFHLSDFFVRLEHDEDKVSNSVRRIVDLMFSDPHCTPAFGEHAMFLAFAASLRSGDLSRQVGAVIAKDREILATGANDCPKFGGGLYWPAFSAREKAIIDTPRGRDSTRGEDSNKAEQSKIIESIVETVSSITTSFDSAKLRSKLAKGPIGDLTEYGRVVHAEMEALLACLRKGISTIGATIYCTTFPCHNCAKHIIAAGISRVVFIEPYIKSKASEFHDDSIRIDVWETSDSQQHSYVKFEPFEGVGPRRFFELFSMNLGVGTPIKRKEPGGKAKKWKLEGSPLRIQMLPMSYLDLEKEAQSSFAPFILSSKV
ncbi:MAG TPA: anti-phage dCTP deaminase [Prosthecobacter sp.]